MQNVNDKNEIWTGNDIGAEGAIMIGEVLKTNTTLTTLNMDGWVFVLYQWRHESSSNETSVL